MSHTNDFSIPWPILLSYQNTYQSGREVQQNGTDGRPCCTIGFGCFLAPAHRGKTTQPAQPRGLEVDSLCVVLLCRSSAYAKHPPVFLAQTSKSDNHADLCACKNYYNSLISNGVSKSQLVLMPPEDEKCFCIGSPAEPTAKGSPYSSKCTTDWGGSQCGVMGGDKCCIGHTLGFAAMVEPATTWVLEVI